MSEMDAPPKMEQFWEDPPGSSCQNQLIHQSNHSSSSGSINQGGLSGGSSTNNVPSNGGSHQQQYERNLNFATGAVEDNEYGFPKKKTVRDPLSHRIIEKRRRDRMNNCLADLARLLPPSSLRKGRGRIEKTEIVELAIKHLRHLQCHPCPTGEKCEFNYIAKSSSKEIPTASQLGNNSASAQPPSSVMSGGSVSISQSSPEEHFRLGFHECMSETMHFLVEEEGMYPGDGMCVRMLQHLRVHSENLMRDHFGKDGKLSLSARPKDEIRVKSVKGSSDTTPEFSTTVGSNGSTSSGYQPNGSSSGSDGNSGQDGEANEPFALPVPNPNVLQHRSSIDRDRTGVNIEYEGENSCCSTQLSLDISDVFSMESKNTNRSASTKPPIPAIICSSSSVHSSPVVLSSSNGRSSDEGQEGQDGGSNSSNSQHRYKFKNNIKQRFNADQVKPEDYVSGSKQSRKHATKGSLKETDAVSLGENGNISDMEEDEEIKLRSTSPIEVLDEDSCISKNFSSSRARRNSTRRTTISTGCQTSETHVTPDCRSIATSTGSSCDALDGERDVKITRAEIVKSLAPVALDKSPVPLILGDVTGRSSPVLTSGKSVGVPAFALHDKGLYYVPLTIDKAALTPYLAKLEPNISPPLHPVTISVCFLLSPETKLNLPLDLEPKALISPPIPISSKISKTPLEFTAATTIPVSIPIVTATATATAAMKVPRSTSSSSSRDVLNSNFNINRYSQSRQYSSPASYRYPISSSNSASFISHGSTHSGSGGNSHAPYYPAGYYGGSSDGSTSHSLHPLPPTHITAGYGSSSSSSSSSGGSRNRKRSVCNISPMSGSSSLGYHSLHEKYPPSAQDFYGYPMNTHSSSTTHSHIHSSSGSSSGSSSFGGHNHHSSPPSYGYSSGNGSSCSSSISMGAILEDKSSNSQTDAAADRNRRSCSPSKRVKRNRDGDEILKPKPLPIGLPIIPLPHNDNVCSK